MFGFPTMALVAWLVPQTIPPSQTWPIIISNSIGVIITNIITVPQIARFRPSNLNSIVWVLTWLKTAQLWKYYGNPVVSSLEFHEDCLTNDQSQITGRSHSTWIWGMVARTFCLFWNQYTYEATRNIVLCSLNNSKFLVGNVSFPRSWFQTVTFGSIQTLGTWNQSVAGLIGLLWFPAQQKRVHKHLPLDGLHTVSP